MVVVNCSRCGKTLQGKAEAAGKQVQCPHCGQILVIAAQAALTHSNPSKRSSAPEPVRAEKSEPHSLLEATVGERPGPLPPEDTISPHPGSPDGEVEKELYDFLAPPRGMGEIGWLGPYRVVKVLGAGGMGVVFEAEDPQLERKVALKAMRPALITSDSAKKRFLREAKTTASIKHDHIVTIFQVGEDRGAPFLAMEFLDGESLDERIKREKKLPLSEVLRIGREIAGGLSAAHEHGLIHRDIKPGNLWLEGKCGRVKILDFGLARAAGDETHLTQPGAIVGTPAYMAPEQAQAEAVDARCDLFSLGCVLYRLGTGELPFKGRDTMSLLLALTRDQPRPPAELNAELPPALSELILKLLAKQRDDRPPSAEVVAETLREIENDPTVPLTFTAKTPRARQRKRPLVIAATVLLAGVVLVAAILTMRTKHGTLTATDKEPDALVKKVARPKPAVDEAWLKAVAALKGQEQVDAVVAKLKDLNPGFEGVVTPTISVGVVTGLVVPSDNLTDLSPLRALPRLNNLWCRASEVNKGGKLADLSPLKGMKLTTLNVAWTRVSDLSPLQGMPLTRLDCSATPLSDLSPLKGMPLTILDCWNTEVSDLSPLKGMKLTHLIFGGTRVSDLSPLNDMPLTSLVFWGTQVSDLAPLKGMKLTYLKCDASKVSDLAPLKGMKLTGLICFHTQVTDLSPLREMPLKELSCDFKPERDAEILRSLKTLERINDKPAADFWKELDAKPPPKQP